MKALSAGQVHIGDFGWRKGPLGARAAVSRAPLSPTAYASAPEGAGMFHSPTAGDVDRVLLVTGHGAAGCSDLGSRPTVP